MLLCRCHFSCSMAVERKMELHSSTQVSLTRNGLDLSTRLPRSGANDQHFSCPFTSAEPGFSQSWEKSICARRPLAWDQTFVLLMQDQSWSNAYHSRGDLQLIVQLAPPVGPGSQLVLSQPRTVCLHHVSLRHHLLIEPFVRRCYIGGLHNNLERPILALRK